MSTPSAAPPKELEEQLARFREQWKAEVQRSKLSHAQPLQAGQTQDGQKSKATAVDTTQASPHEPQQQPRERAKLIPKAAPRVAEPPPVTPAAPRVQPHTVPLPVPVELTPKQRAAAEVYRQAIILEQDGDHAGATELYKKAFRMHDHVDHIYRTLEVQQEALTISPTPHIPSKAKHARTQSREHHPHPYPQPHRPDVHHLIEGIKNLEVSSRHRKPQTPILLHPLIAEWAPPLDFRPEDEKESIPIASVPDELLLYILSMLDVMSLERFALVNRKARVITLDSGLWRTFVEKVYIPPQVEYDEEIEDLLPDYMHDYRRVYIEHPRVRLDGVYIAVCHYIRNGLSENAWVNVSHLITYNRYLRFYADGTVLSLLANEEVSPQYIIPLLQPSLRQKGFFIGQWRLEGLTVHITDLTDPTGLTSTSSRYTFRMTLELRSRPGMGRWNRLGIKAYESVDLETGEAMGVPLKNDRPFWFSKVRSYG